MRVLFDHNVPKRLRQFLSGHEVRTAREMGWEEMKNGELMTVAESSGFAVMVTADKNLSYQQNLRRRELALIVLSTNDWKTLRGNPAPVAEALNKAEPGTFQSVKIENRGCGFPLQA